MKSAKLGGNILDNINMIGNTLYKIADQFQYEEDYEVNFSQNKKKTMNKTSSVDLNLFQTNSDSADGSILKKNPLFRLYSPSNPVLK